MKALRTKFAVSLLFLATSGTLFTGCATSQTQRGARIGSGAGITVGTLIGKAGGNVAMGAIIGGAIGGTAGAYIGKTMDKQATEIKQTVPGAKVTREGEAIVVKFNTGILFEMGGTDLTADARSNLHNLAVSMHQNPETNISIIGYTDSLGTADYNMDLSMKRANSVKTYLVTDSVSEGRITTSGKGASEPVADNKTPEGRSKNRRVEIIIVANEKLKQQAKDATK